MPVDSQDSSGALRVTQTPLDYLLITMLFASRYHFGQLELSSFHLADEASITMAASWLERDGRLRYPPPLVLISTRLPSLYYACSLSSTS